jgi:hypothetical protein
VHSLVEKHMRARERPVKKVRSRAMRG